MNRVQPLAIARTLEQQGWKALHFEVLRRGGLFAVRCTGLSKVFPKAFHRGGNGDYFVSVPGRDAKEMAQIFCHFLRGQMGCSGSVQHLSGRPDGEGVQDYVFWGLPARPPAKGDAQG